ncbi:hypothetical protein TL16_g01188 [Triparma laevis f. inornata]|uniref:Uncharacterized protein n=1 Tax=Triparma laevis f. inornata TaxID=1714386 RepID=A0A9W6ZJ31_9STRA|nr:hypothetical protein TL16_g01188 [Triparma laevis f. inornata]
MHADIAEEYQYFERYCIVEFDKAYFKVFSKEDDYWNPNRYNGPIHAAFLHSAKITETGRLVVDGQPHFTFSITSIGKVSGEAAKGPQNFVFNMACTMRKQVREWVKALGKAIVSIADLPDVRHRVHKASRHKVNTDWKSKHLVIRHKNHKKGDYSRRKPSMENDAVIESPREKEPPIAEPSITLHPFDRRWKLSENNFSKTPARAKTATAAEVIPDYIIKAIMKNDLDEIIIWLSTHRAFDHMMARSGEKILHCACGSGQMSLVTFFLEKGAKPDLVDGYGETPMYCAVKNRNKKIVAVLLKAGAKINHGADDQVTPLALACANGDFDMASYLLEEGANPMRADIRGITPFFTACAQGHVKIVRMLLQMNTQIPGIVDINKHTNNDITPLYASCQRGCLEIVQMLVKLGAKWDEPNLQLITPFHSAVERGEISVMQYLLSLEPPSDPFKTNSTDMTCLHTAAKFGRNKSILMLLDLGLDINASDMYGATPLDVARSFRKSESVKLILERGGIAGEDYMRDPKSRAKSMFAKQRMAGAGTGDGRVVTGVDGSVEVVGLRREGEVFGIDDDDDDDDDLEEGEERDVDVKGKQVITRILKTAEGGVI